MNAIVPIPKCEISIRLATMDDLPFIDQLQKKHSKQLGFFPRAQMEGYIKNEWMLVAEEARSQEPEARAENSSGSRLLAPGSSLLGYVASRDRYLKRDELGVVYQLCVAPTLQRKLIGAALVKAVFERSAYGCRLYCCWCAQDLDANYFWESLGFVPVAFRAGSSGKKRVHIFWQKRICEGDAQTKWWYPCQTNQGAIREDRLVFPIPPGTHWKEVQAVVVSGTGAGTAIEDKTDAKKKRSSAGKVLGPARRTIGSGTIAFEGTQQASPRPRAKVKQVRTKQKNDPRHVTAARELRDRYLEKINEVDGLLSAGKYDVARLIDQRESQRTPAALPAAA